jgi:hypothetical protein
LRDNDGNPASNDVVTLFLLACFGDKRILNKGVEVKLIVKDIGGKANSCINRILEEDILVIWGCGTLAKILPRW